MFEFDYILEIIKTIEFQWSEKKSEAIKNGWFDIS